MLRAIHLLSFMCLLAGCIISGEQAADVSSTTAAASPTAPNSASALAWVQTSPYNSTSISITWSISGSANLASQTVQYFEGATCSGAQVGANVAKTAVQNTDSVVFPADNTYSFKIITTNTSGYSDSGVCVAAPMVIDTSGPAAATGISWAESSPHNGLSVTAQWTPSHSTGLASQTIQFYEEDSSNCTANAVGGPVTLGTATTYYSFNGASGESYKYTITTSDGVNPDVVSACSSAMRLDTSAPAAASGLGWSAASPYNSTSVNASWTPSVSTDLASQKIQFYTDSSCTTSHAGPYTLLPAATSYSLPSASSGTSYYYKITSVDAVALETASACSSAMAIDTSAPAAATSLSWASSSPSSATGVTAIWAISSASDVANQEIEFYTGSCPGTVHTAWASTAATTTSTAAFTGTNANTHYFRIRTTDNAGNVTLSSCSSAMSIDTTAPAAASALSGSSGTVANGGAIGASWTKSVATDIAYQSIQFYNTTGCGAAFGSAVILSSSAVSYNYTPGADGTAYGFIVTSVDTAGNPTASACSADIVVDTAAPAAATADTWAEVSPSGDLTASVNWTASAAGDLDSETITYYSDSSCATVYDTHTSATTGDTLTITTNENEQNFYYQITSYDTAGNPTSTVCSSAMQFKLNQIQLTDSASADSDLMGAAVSIYGTYAAVGVPAYNTNTGAVIIYEKSSGVWSQVAKLTASDGSSGDLFGSSVALDSATLLVGAPGDLTGSAYIFKRESGSWLQQQKLFPSLGTPASGDQFGGSVALSGNYLIVGAPYWDGGGTDQGGAYIFYDNGSSWVEDTLLYPSAGTNDNDHFGFSVGIDGIYAIVGAPGWNGDSTGAVFFYEYGGSWALSQAAITGSTPADQLGYSVDLNGSKAIIGAVGAEEAYVYTLTTSWGAEQTLSPAATGFGTSVAISGSYLVVGAPGAEAIYTYVYDGTPWAATANSPHQASDTNAGDLFGNSVDIFSTTTIVGAPYWEDAGTDNGSAYIQISN